MGARGLQLRLLGPVTVARDGVPVVLPRSRKVLALLAFLTLEATPHSRSRLCDLLWDAPNDPRGELRWCLSKLRALVDDVDRRRVVSSGNALVSLDLSDAFVDAFEIGRAVEGGLSDLTCERLTEIADLFHGDLLEGVEVDGSPELTAWLGARRQRYRASRLAVVSELARRPSVEPDVARRRLDAWREVAPFDRRAHEALLAALLKSGCIRAAEEHMAATIRVFEQENLDWSALRTWWHAARGKAFLPSPATVLEVREPPPQGPPRTRRRASVAVMPFVEAASTPTPRSQLVHGLTDDIITRLAKLRALFVIARGTAYALGDRGIDAQEAGRILDVEYVASGHVRRKGDRVSVVLVVHDVAARVGLSRSAPTYRLRMRAGRSRVQLRVACSAVGTALPNIMCDKAGGSPSCETCRRAQLRFVRSNSAYSRKSIERVILFPAALHLG
jgi:DNA-binding SARP family transcriptional activator/TolB-like protein